MDTFYYSMSEDIRTKSLTKSKIFLIIVLIAATAGIVLIIAFSINQLSDGTIQNGGG